MFYYETQLNQYSLLQKKQSLIISGGECTS